VTWDSVPCDFMSWLNWHWRVFLLSFFGVFLLITILPVLRKSSCWGATSPVSYPPPYRLELHLRPSTCLVTERGRQALETEARCFNLVQASCLPPPPKLFLLSPDVSNTQSVSGDDFHSIKWVSSYWCLWFFGYSFDIFGAIKKFQMTHTSRR
jgi:hypothetical protein